MEISNEEIARHIVDVIFEGSNNESFYNMAVKAALQMAERKNKQLTKEKQKLIEEACNWLEKNDSYAIPTNVQVDRLRKYLNKVKGVDYGTN